MEREHRPGRLHDAPKQFSLDFGMPLRKPERISVPRPDKLFFAVLPPPAAGARIAEQAERLRTRHGLRPRLKAAELLHVSLTSVGEFSGLPNDVLAAALRAGSDVEVAPFVVTFDRVLSFRNGSRRPFVLLSSQGTVELTRLSRALRDSMRIMGLRLGNLSGFTPHVTLLYDEQVVPEVPIDEPITWTVGTFVLVHSLHGQARHVHFGRWPLTG